MESERKIVEKCGNYKWPKILEIQSRFTKILLKIINEKISELKKCNEKPNILKKSKHHEY